MTCPEINDASETGTNSYANRNCNYNFDFNIDPNPNPTTHVLVHSTSLLTYHARRIGNTWVELAP